MSNQERRQYWQQQVDEWSNSGLSAAAYCKQYQLTYHQFIYWCRKLKSPNNEKQTTEKGVSGFARGTVVTESLVSETDGLTLTLSNGISITGLHSANISLLSSILRMLS